MSNAQTNGMKSFQSLETFHTNFPIIGKLVCAVLVSCMLGMTASATTYTVTETTDDGAGTTVGSLSWAITQANASTAVDDTIAFNLTSGDTVAFENVLPAITDSVSIDGVNVASGNNVTVQVEIPGVSASRIFDVNVPGEAVSLADMTLLGGDLGPVVDNGGAVNLTAGTLTMDRCVLQGSSAYSGGGLYVASAATAILSDCVVSSNTTSSGDGGGIHNNGTLTISGCTISDNTASGHGGGIYNASSVYLNNVTINGNMAGYGGGLHNQSDAYLANSTISGNTASTSGGGMYNSTTSYMLNTIIIDNTAVSGGDIYNDDGYVAVYYCWYNNTIGTITTEADAPNVTDAYTSGDLGALADNGGLTRTMALSSSAPAYQTGAFVYYNSTDVYYFVDNTATSHKLTDWAVNPTVDDADKITTDQRGVTRGSPSSMGAYEYSAPSFAGGSGTASDPYQVSSAAELAYLAELVNAGTTDDSNGDAPYSALCYVLTASFSLSGETWVPIGTNQACSFSGSFDGNGKTITALTIGSVGTPEAAYRYAGLFGYVKGVIENVTLSNASIYVSDSVTVGALAGRADASRITGCSAISCSVQGTMVSNFCASLLGYVSSRSVISDCHAVDVSVRGRFVGGLIGKLLESTVVSDCSVTNSTVVGFKPAGLVGCGNNSTLAGCRASSVTVTGESPTNTVPGDYDYCFAGGLIAEAIFMTIADCSADCIVSGVYAGGLIGDTETSVVSDSSAAGTVTGSTDSSGNGSAGGFVGWAIKKDIAAGGCVFRNCTSAAAVSQSSASGTCISGGFAGYATDSEMSDCSSGGNVGAAVYAGGFIGASARTTITDCSAGGSVGTASYGGGFVGYLADETIQTCCATGTVAAGYYVGGFAGKAEPGSAIVNCYASSELTDAWIAAGGVAGYMNGGTIENCYYPKKVNNFYWAGVGSGVGGVVGGLSNSTITHGYCLDSNSNTVGKSSGSTNDSRKITAAYLVSTNFVNELNTNDVSADPWYVSATGPVLEGPSPSSSNQAPTASDVEIRSGGVTVTTAYTGDELLGSYTFNDADSDAEGMSVYSWYRSDDASGTNKTAISGAIGAAYTPGSADIGKFISFMVQPIDEWGGVGSNEVESAGTVEIVVNPFGPSGTSALVITTVAGDGTSGYSGDGGAAVLAQLQFPCGVAIDDEGNLFIADCTNHCVRKVDTNGDISTVAGTGAAGYNGDDIVASTAQLNAPEGVAVDADGNLLIADTHNQRIRLVDTNGMIHTIAGNGTAGYAGDGGAATNARFNYPQGLALDGDGNLLIADTYNQRIRRVDTNSVVTTVAGMGSYGYNGDGIVATSAQLNYPVSVTVDSDGNLLIADRENHRIRQVDTNSVISTVVGTGIPGYSGDDGTAALAQLDHPSGVACDDDGTLVIADRDNQRIRQVDTNSVITTMVGTGTGGYNGDDIVADTAELNYPQGIALDGHGDLYIADTDNQRIRKVELLVSADIIPSNGPYAGGNTITITNGNFGTITNVLVGGIAATIVDSGMGWATITMPSIGTTGTVDVVVQTSDNGDATLSNAYTYNAAGNIGGTAYDWTQWQAVPGLPQARYYSGGDVLDGKMYVVGGNDAANTAMTNVYMFDGNSWTEVAGLPQALCETAVATYDGALYSIGGYTGSSRVTNVYKFSGTAWTEVAGLPAPRFSMGAAVLGSNLIAYGGRNSGGALTNVFSFDGSSWTEITGMNPGKFSMGYAAYSGKVYSVGGYTYTSATYEYDGSTWSAVSNYPVSGGCAILAGATLDGYMYMYGGQDFSADLTNAFRYDGNAWNEIVGLPTAMSALGAAAYDGSLYAFGGRDGSTTLTNVYRYPGQVTSAGVTPASGFWTGGYSVVISGVNLGNGSDITNVTICGVSVDRIDNQSATQLVVTVAQALAPGLGDVVVYSTSYGITTKSNVFTYTSGQMTLLGTNGAVIASGNTAQYADGSKFPGLTVGASLTNTFSITNSGNASLTISGVTTNGANPDQFIIHLSSFIIPAGGVTSFTVVYAPTAIGSPAASLSISSDDPASPFIFNVAGSCFEVSTNVGPYAGGNTVTFTNGDFGTITNVLVGGVAATILDSGTSWFTITIPSIGTNGTVDVMIQTSDNGETVLANAYTYHPAGSMGGMIVDGFVWTNLAQGLNSTVYAVYAATNGTIYAGGVFTQAVNGAESLQRVARWDGTAWTNMGIGFNNIVRGIEADASGTLYTVGDYNGTYGFSQNCRRIGRWDGENWTNMGKGFSSAAYTIVFDTNDVPYVGGSFTADGYGRNFGYAVTWDGGNWTNIYYSPLTNVIGFGSSVRASVTAPDGKMYFAGDFTNAITPSGTTNLTRVAMWDGTDLHALGNGLNSSVYALAMDSEGTLYAGGLFTASGSQAMYFIARWDGVNWTNVGSGMGGLVYALAVDANDNLYAGGSFNTPGAKLAMWDGVSWNGMSSSEISGDIYALDLYSNETMLVGGGFVYAGAATNRIGLVHPNRYYSPGTTPTSGSWTGGYTVAIVGDNIGGGDITNVTLCGVQATILSQVVDRVWVRAGQSSSAMLGDVVIQSISYGTTIGTNAFTYNAPGLQVLGTNGVVVTSGEAASDLKGTKFGHLLLGSAWTNVFAITNNGTAAVSISGFGISDARFAVAGMPASVDVGGVSNVAVTFTPTSLGGYAAVLRITNNSPTTAYVVNLAGSCYAASTNVGPYAGGNTVMFTNGNFGTITNVLVGGVVATIVDSGANWFTITMPSIGTNGVVDVTVQTSDNGETVLAGAYTYNPQGVISSALVFYPFDNNADGNSGFNYTIFNSRVLESSVRSIGDGLFMYAVDTDNWSGTNQLLLTAPNAIVTNADVATAISSNWYFGFMLTPNSTMDIESIEADWSRGGSADIRGWFVRSSLDDYTTDLYTNETPSGTPTGVSHATIDLTGFTGLNTSVTFRFYIYTPSPNRYMDFRHIQINGPDDVVPTSGSWTGGYPVVISGMNLGNGEDITNVTLCGASATIESQSATQIVVTAGVAASAGIGDVRVYSTSFGETVKSNAFTYNAPGLRVLGTNGAAIASGDAAQTANGTKFRPLQVGASWTNTFSITNNGTETLMISGFGNSNSRFEITGLPASVAVGGVSNFTVRFAPTSVGTYNGVLTITNDSPTAAYVVRLYGPCYRASTNVGPFDGGNTITIMNGNFGDITNVLVDGVAATLVESSGSIFTIILPAATNAGTVDLIVQTSDEGDILLEDAYTYNPAGEIGWITTEVSWTNIGSGMSDWVEGLAHDGTTLYAGGLFTNAGAVTTKYIAQWNGTNWSSLGTGMGGTGPRVVDMEYDGTNLYAGGVFTTAGGVGANQVARWNGSGWSALGAGVGASGNGDLVWDVLFADGNLYAAGRFTNSGATAVMNIAVWNGSTWAPLGDGLGLAATIDDSYDVRALAYDGANLYAGGVFTTAGGLTVNHVAMWNGTSWTNLGSGLDDEVWALLHDGTNLYAAGAFHTAGGVTAHRIAMWNGTSWTNLGSGMDYSVGALAHDGTNLYAGGAFSTAGGVPANRVAKWNGSTWSALGSGMAGNIVRSLLFNGMDLYAGGWFSAAGGVPATNIAQWKTTITTNEGVAPAFGSWTGGYEVVISGSNLGNGSDITNVTLCGVSASLQSQNATQVVVFAASSETVGAGDVRVYSTSYGETVKNNAFTYNGPHIQVSGSAFSPTVFGATVTNMFTVTNSGTEALIISAATNAGSGAALFNASAMPAEVAPGTASNFPVVFTASTIGSFAPTVYVANNSPVPSYTFGLTGSVFNLSTNVGPLAGGNTITVTNGNFGAITNVLVGSTSVTPSVFGANWFTITLPASVGAGTVNITVQTSDHGDITLPNAYTYNPAGQIGWTTGMTIWTNMGSGVNNAVLAMYSDGANLYAGGQFTTAGGVAANRIAQWNGTSWTNLGTGLDNSVYDISGDGTNLYAVGSFGWAGGVAASAIARWNGETWTNLGGGLVGGSGAAAVLIAGSTVYASGYFTNAGGVATKYIAAWDGTSWTNLGTGLNSSGRCLAHDGTNLYVGGQFTNAGGVSVMNVAKWDGTNWSTLGSGIGDRWANVYKLIYTGSTLYACGMFWDGGGKARVARWNGSSWTDVSGGVGGDAFAMAHDGTNLYVGGNFTSPGNYVAKWNGAAWSALGSGLNSPAWALAHNGTTLYAGGGFSSAGGVSVSRLAMWTPMVATNYGVAPMSGSWTGGYEVVISGMNLCNGSLSDVTGVTLCGVTATVTGVSGSTQIVVTVGAATTVGTGHVVVVSTDYGTTIKSNIFAYSRAAQMALTFSPTSPQAYGTTNGLTVAGGSGTGVVSFAVTSGPGLIVGSTNLTITAGTGDVVVVATKAQDDLYLASSATATVTAAKATQTITLDNPGPQVTTNHVGLQVTASSGLQVTCAVVSGSATITGYTNMTFSGAGSVVLAASQAGDSNWYAAATVTQSFTVVKTAQSALTFTPTSPQTYNTTNALTTSGGSGTGTVSYAVTSGGGTIVALTNLVVTTGTGSVVIVATKAEDEMYLVTAATGTVTCAKALAPVFLLDLAQVYNGTARTISATTLPAGLTVEFTYEGQAIAPTNAGSYAVTGTVNEINYQGLTTGTLVVARALDTITFSATNQAYSGTNKAVTATAGSGSSVAVTYNGSATPPVNVGAYAVTGVVDAANWVATNTTTLTIIKGDQVITNFLPADGVQFVLNSSTSVSAQASSGLPVSFSNLTPEIASLVGASIHFTNPGVARVQAYQLGNTNWNAATPVTHEWRVGGLITNLTPAVVNVGGGIDVVVRGVMIGNGTDITNVTLAGVMATIVTQTENDVTVLAGVAPAAVTGDVEVTSGTGGYMVLSNAFEYLWLDAPVQLDPVDVTGSNLLARWLTATGATTHLLDVGLNTNFTFYLPGYERVDVALAQQYPVTGLTNGTWYAIRLFGWNTNGYSWPSRTVWVPTGTNTPYETHPPMSGPVSQGAVMQHPLSNMFYGVGLVYTAESSDTNVMSVAVVDGQLVMTPGNLGTATITVHVTNPVTGYTASYSFTVQVVGEPALVSTNFLPREAWNPRFTQVLQVRNDSGVDAIGVRVLFTNLMPGITVENQTGTSADGRPMIEMETAFTNGATLDLNIVYLCTGAYRADLNPPTLELQYILPEWTVPLPGEGTVIGSGYALPDGRILIQFDSVVGHLYAIEYCANFPTGDWMAIPLRVRATANRTQWIDSGPPATQPFKIGEVRTYRIKEVTE